MSCARDQESYCDVQAVITMEQAKLAKFEQYTHHDLCCNCKVLQQVVCVITKVSAFSKEC